MSYTPSKEERAQAEGWREEKTFAAAWRRYRQFASSGPWVDEVELPFFELDDDSPEYERLTLHARSDARVLLVCEKMHVQKRLDTWSDSDPAQPSVAHRTRATLAWTQPLASRWVARTLRQHAASLAIPMAFFGDLDPQAIHSFVMLRAGGREATRRGRGSPIPITWLGLDDVWLDWVCWGLGTKEVPRGITIRLDWLDQVYWSLIERHVPGVRRLIGRRACALLDSGVKIEADAFRGPPFLQEMERRIAALTSGSTEPPPWRTRRRAAR